MNTEHEPPSSYATLLLERRDGIAQITLNRPEKLNALNLRLQSDLTQALAAIGRDDSVQVVILTGAGRGFSAGLDLRDFQTSLTHFQDRPPEDSVFQRLESLPQPVIAAVNGPAVTGGFELALACDVIVASRAARFADTHALLGVPPGAGLSQKLSRIIGAPRAMALSLTGDFLTAEDAWRAGLVSHLCEPDELLPVAWSLAERMTAAEPFLLREMKRLIRDGARMPLADALRFERDAHDAWARQADMSAVLVRREQLLHRHRGQGHKP